MNEHRKSVEADINADWSAGRFTAAYEKICNGLCPILRDSLKSRGNKHHDAEDIVSAAMYGFAKKLNKDGPESIDEPCHYLQAAVTNRMRDHRAKMSVAPVAERLEHDNRQVTDVATVPGWNKRAVFLVQAVSEIDEIAESDAKRLVTSVFKQMRPIYKRILRDLLKHGPRGSVTEAAARVRTKRGTYAVQKTRAFKIFGQLALPTAKKLGIKWRGITEEKEPLDFVHPTERDSNEPDDSDGFL